MRNLKKLLPMFALVIGATVAFAQNSPFESKKQTFTYYRVGGEWVEAIPGYSCTNEAPEICSQVFDHENPEPQESGTGTVYGEYLPD